MKHVSECIPARLIRNPYNYDRALASVASGLLCPEATRTQQQFKEECDINTIVERFGLTGELPENLKVPVSGDFTAVTDFQSAMQLIRSSQEAFMEMPASVRERFNNDPGAFVDFVSDPENREEARKLGILNPAPTPYAPLEVRVVNPPEASAGRSGSEEEGKPPAGGKHK